MKDNFLIEIAGFTIGLSVRTEYSRRFCKDFIVERKTPLFSVSVSDSELEEQRKAELLMREAKDLPMSSDAYIENVCLYREIAEKLPLFDRFVFHGASVETEGKGFIFTAPPGTGKSTHIRLWKDLFGDKVTVINGDKPIVGVENGIFTVFSSPWSGKEGWKTNTKAPLSGICIIARGLENKISRIDPKDRFEELMRQVYLPKDPQARLITLDLLNSLSKKIPFYILECNISREAAELSYKTMVE